MPTVHDTYSQAEADRGRSSRWRTILVSLLVALGSLLALLSLVAVWLNTQIEDTDAYVSAVAPLAADPAIQSAVATRVTDSLFEQAAVEQRVSGALPEQARFFAAPVTDSLRGFVQGQAERLFATPQFSELWEKANRQVHDLLTEVALGESRGRISFSEGKVTLKLGDFATALRSRLESRGLNIFPDPGQGEDAGELILFQSEGLARLQGGIALLNRLAFWLPPLSLLSLLAALIMARNRYHTAIGAGLGLAASAVTLKVLLGIGRNYLLESANDQAAAGRFFDIILVSLVRSGQYLFLLGLLIIGIAVLAGPAPPMVRLRKGVKVRLRGTAGAIKTPAGPWLGAHKNSLRLGGAVAVLLMLILRDQPSAFFVLGLVFLLLVFLAALELLGQKPAQPQEEEKRWEKAAQ